MNKFKVLIADSSSSVRQYIKYALQDYFKNLELEVATNGKNIQKRLESSHYDLILYDRDMPMLKGDELLKWLRNHEALKNTSFIMISGDRDEDSLKRAVELGADAYLLKPLLQEPLVNKVKEIFNKCERDKCERIKHERIMGQGEVSLKFNGRENRGRLVNINMGGILAIFNREGPLPHILEKIQVSLELENKKSIDGIEGEIIRIQAVDSSDGPRQIQYAAKFVEEISTEKKRDLFDIISSLKL